MPLSRERRLQASGRVDIDPEEHQLRLEPGDRLLSLWEQRMAALSGRRPLSAEEGISALRVERRIAWLAPTVGAYQFPVPFPRAMPLPGLVAIEEAFVQICTRGPDVEIHPQVHACESPERSQRAVNIGQGEALLPVLPLLPARSNHGGLQRPILPHLATPSGYGGRNC
ncbi:hypothetical protein SPI_04904 [Niveomyces insectorum RCEF 264]|uniref:Uncharacterized protein n=1 Tax=Niveomyces insectorum RCEF 264 TaxID=1081102 RepID=A0A167UYU5_9HYPO|nr:hypothetical protein SPI_04904 [Niveomyces insectorum RCEF 264]